VKGLVALVISGGGSGRSHQTSLPRAYLA